VKLNAIRSNAGLAVKEVPECDAGDFGACAETDRSASFRHLPAVSRLCTLRAGAGWRLRDHLVRGVLLENEVHVTVGLTADQRDRRDDREDAAFEREPPSW
jgi:hypothetical protein